MLPDHKLDEVSDFIGFVLSREKKKKRKIVQLEGIWEGKGFEKLDLNKELRAIRKEVEKSILKIAGIGSLQVSDIELNSSGMTL